MSHARDVSKFVKFITDDYKVAEEFIDSDTLAVSANKSLRASTGTKGYNTPADLPANAPAGTQGFVTSNNRLYISNGSGWYNIALINRTPYWITQPDGSYTLDTTGQATVITILGGDSDGYDVPQYTATGDSNFNAIATVTKDSDNGRVFIVRAIDSDNSSTKNSGTGTLTFTLTDGKQSVLANSTFTINFTPDWTSTYVQRKVKQASPATNDYFGRYGLDMSGDGLYLAVGAGQDDGGGIANAGTCTIFYRSSATTWSSQSQLLASDKQAQDYFGDAVGLNSDGTYCIVGAKFEDTKGDNAGAAYIFTRTGSSWSQQAKIMATNGAAGHGFGNAVAISGDGNWAAVYGNQSVYTYLRSGSTWSQQQIITTPSGSGTAFGYLSGSIGFSDDGSYLIVGNYNDATDGANTGRVFVFTRSGSTFSLQQALSPDVITIGYFGTACKITPNGDYAVIGAAYQSTGKGYIFTRSGSTWTQQAELIGSDVDTNGDQFSLGLGISENGDIAVFGAPGEDDGAGNPLSNAGAAYVFTRSGSTWTQTRKIQASDKDAGDEFGATVAINRAGDIFAVGAFQDDDGAANSGAAYIFHIN